MSTEYGQLEISRALVTLAQAVSTAAEKIAAAIRENNDGEARKESS